MGEFGLGDRVRLETKSYRGTLKFAPGEEGTIVGFQGMTMGIVFARVDFGANEERPRYLNIATGWLSVVPTSARQKARVRWGLDA